MSYSTLAYLRHILNETQYLIEQTKELDKEEFLENETLQRAFVRSIEIIGEAAKQIPNDLRQRYSQIQWREMGGMRDRLIHEYFGIDYDIVWDVVTNNVPILHREIQQIIQNEAIDE